ncbi:protein rolling stone-like [Phthorimaea operculella]|nr:protein rolling stone-like [Phthorimaea operculella]
MGKFLRKQFQASQFSLNHRRPSDFCLSCWQKNSSSLPLLCVRVFIFLACLFILITSMVVWNYNFGLWFIFLTNWGVFIDTVASFFAVVVSLHVYRKGPFDPSSPLPWYVKAFWASYDIAVMMSFFITAYYFALLRMDYSEFGAWDIANDVLTHGANSVLMFFLLMTSRLPSRVLHFIYPVCFALVYVIFSLIYYLAGGKSPFDEHYIYPFLDWERLELTIPATIVTAILIILMHELVVGMASFRNWLSKGYRPDSQDKPIFK